KLVDHRVDRVLQLLNLSLHVDGDLLRQVAVRHGLCHVGDVPHLRRKVAGHEVDRVGQVLPHAGHALYVGLPTEPTLRPHTAVTLAPDLSAIAIHFPLPT